MMSSTWDSVNMNDIMKFYYVQIACFIAPHVQGKTLISGKKIYMSTFALDFGVGFVIISNAPFSDFCCSSNRMSWAYMNTVVEWE
jgi:hypothetical protein